MKKIYAVAVGNQTGLFTKKLDFDKAIENFEKPIYKTFEVKDRSKADTWYNNKIKSLAKLSNTSKDTTEVETSTEQIQEVEGQPVNEEKIQLDLNGLIDGEVVEENTVSVEEVVVESALSVEEATIDKIEVAASEVISDETVDETSAELNLDETAITKESTGVIVPSIGTEKSVTKMVCSVMEQEGKIKLRIFYNGVIKNLFVEVPEAKKSQYGLCAAEAYGSEIALTVAINNKLVNSVFIYYYSNDLWDSLIKNFPQFNEVKNLQLIQLQVSDLNDEMLR